MVIEKFERCTSLAFDQNPAELITGEGRTVHINIQWCISRTQHNFIMFIIVLGQHVSILTESSSGPSKKQILT